MVTITLNYTLCIINIKYESVYSSLVFSEVWKIVVTDKLVVNLIQLSGLFVC